MRLTIGFAVMLPMLALAQQSGPSVAFVNVNVISLRDDSIVTGRTVVVDGERIVAIGGVEDTVLPDAAVVVDGTDRYLMPGLAEMHGHVTDTSSPALDRVLGLYVANGITTVRGMLGRPAHLELRQQILDQEVLGPRLITSGPSFNGNSVSSPEQGADMVREQHAAGYDFLKIHPGLTRAEFTAIAQTANELGIPFAGHVPSDVGLRDTMTAGIATVDHLDGYMEALISPNEDPSGGLGGFFGLLLAGAADESRIGPIVQATVDAGVWNVPTESLFEHTANDIPAEDIGAWPEMKYVPRSSVDRWIEVKREIIADRGFERETADRAIALRRQLILELHRAGAGLLLGSDSPQRFNVPGFAVHRELEYIVAAGLTPLEALQTGTVNPARFFSTEDEWGTVEVGKIADLVLLDENPLEDILNSRRVHGTMLRGRWVSRSELDRILERAERN